MALSPKQDHTRRRVIVWVLYLALIGASMAASGRLDWPLIGAAQPTLPADFRQAAMSVAFNLWFLASSVTLFALIQQAVQRRKQRRSAVPMEGSLTRREFLLVGGMTAAAVGLVGVVRLIWDGTSSNAETAASATGSEIVPVENTVPVDNVVPVENISPAATTVPAATTAQTIATGRRLCDRGCSYPGHCGRYQDNNGNGTCDLTEAIW